jgi:hypothetical protein
MSSVFAGRIGVVIETAPGHFITVVMRGTKANIEREYDDVTDYFADTFRRCVPSSRIKIELEGFLIDQSQATADDAAWVTEATSEIEEPKRAIENVGASDRLTAT